MIGAAKRYYVNFFFGIRERRELLHTVMDKL